MTLSQAQKRHLRGLAHARKPVVWIGQHGVTDGVRRELETALAAHELIKVSVRVGDRVKRDALVAGLAAALGAELVQRIGNVVTLYRANPDDPRLALPVK
jgi:RNA-binding protein